MMRALAIVLVALAGVAAGWAQDKAHIKPSWLVGDWVAECDGFAEGARCELYWSVARGGQTMVVRYSVIGRDGSELFRGNGVYEAVGDAFEGGWFDTNGSVHPLEARFVDGALTTLWGRPETEEGRTVYALDGAGGMSVTDWVKVDGEWREFMHAAYRRADRNG